MKLVVAIIHGDDARDVVEALLRSEFQVTRFDSSGGFLRKANATLLVGVEEADVNRVIAVIRSTTKARTETTSRPANQKVDLRPAIVFVVDVAGFARL
jgi:uncharacterized protein YaaQ